MTKLQLSSISTINFDHFICSIAQFKQIQYLFFKMNHYEYIGAIFEKFQVILKLCYFLNASEDIFIAQNSPHIVQGSPVSSPKLPVFFDFRFS